MVNEKDIVKISITGCFFKNKEYKKCNIMKTKLIIKNEVEKNKDRSKETIVNTKTKKVASGIEISPEAIGRYFLIECFLSKG